MKRGLALVVLAACAANGGGGGGSKGIVAAWTARALRPPDCGAPPSYPHWNGEIGLEGLDPDLHVKLDQRVRANEIAALHIEYRSCNVAIELLACTRHALYVSTPRNTGAVDIVPQSKLLRGGGDVAGGGTLALVAGPQRLRLSIDHRETGERTVSWEEDIRASSFPSKWGAWVAKETPPLAVEELRGADCERATHWVSAVVLGTYRVLAENDPIDMTSCWPGQCSEPVAIKYQRVFGFSLHPRAPSFFPPPGETVAIPCPPPIAGEPTQQAAMAHRLFEGEKWLDAALALTRVADGETGDDLGNRAVADYRAAVSFANLGYLKEADAKMRAIAGQSCHPKRNQAGFWLTARDRRTAF